MCSIDHSIPLQRRHSGESTSHTTKDFANPECISNGQPGEWCLVISETFQPGRPRPYGAKFPHQTDRCKQLHLLINIRYNAFLDNGRISEACLYPRNSAHDGIRGRKIADLGVHSRTRKLFWNLPSRTDCSRHHVCTSY